MASRYRPGVVRDAIEEYLRGCPDGAEVSQIYEGVNSQMGSDVPRSSVRSYLRLNEGTAFERFGRGQYRLWGPKELDSAPKTPSVPVFTFGDARLFQANCFSWLREAEPNSVSAVVTDPPYGLVEYSETEQRKRRSGVGGVWRIPPSFDGHARAPVPRFTVLKPADIANLDVFFFQWADLLLRALVPGAHVFVASNPLLSHVVSGALARAGLERRGEVVRLVMTLRGGDRPKNAHTEYPGVTVMPRSMWEPWLLFRKPLAGRVQDNLRAWGTGGLRRPSGERPFGDVVASAPARPAERRLAPHPSLKPQNFLRQIVRASLPLGEGVVLDPFAGSGSTLAAAEAVGYQSIGIENDPEFVQMAALAIPALARMKV